MANNCYFRMVLKGTENDIETFKGMLLGNNGTRIGEGVYAECLWLKETKQLKDGNVRCVMQGLVRLNVYSALIDSVGYYNNRKELFEGYRFITLFDACKELNLDMECYSIEYALCIEEHYLFLNGELVEEVRSQYEEEWNEDGSDYKRVGELEWKWNI